MSSGLMSCVRENSPPLELDLSASGPLSLPEGKGRSGHGYQGHPSATSTPIASPQQQPAATTTTTTTLDGSSTNVEQQQQQQKRRRFHPLRNLRRIFRRRTINSADSAAAAAAESQTAGSCNTLPPPASSASEKNLRSIAIAGVSCSSSTTEALNSASSPVSPHDNSYQTQSLPKSKSYGAHRDELLSVLLGKKRASKQQQEANNQHQPQVIQADAMYQTQRPQQMGVAVFPVDTMGMSRNSYYAEKRLHHRQLLRSTVGDSTQDLLDAEDSGAVGVNATDMSDSQRSLSEARLLDVDGNGYTRESLSQSHDSVFSESATASSLSIVLKAELTDVLRKRRNRPDASDEDLGLPRSPVSPQRLAGAGQSRKANSYQSRSHEASSSLSLLSVNSTDNEDNSQSHRQQHTSSLEHSSSSSVVLLRDHHNEDDVDAVGVERQRLSHAAAKHKMAIRPIKKKGPTRQHRRTLETSIPEANEELVKQAQNPNLRALKDVDLKTKTRSLPPGSSLTATNNNNSTRNKTIEQKNSTITTSSSSHTTTSTSTSTSTSSSSSQAFGLRALTFKAANALFDGRGESSTDVDDSVTNTNTTTSDSSEPGFLRRLIHRNSKRSIARANDGLEDVDNSQNSAKKLQISTSCLEAASREPVQLSSKSRSATSHEQNIQETRQIIKREIHNEGKHGLNAMVSNYGVQPQPPTPVKPKSGPAARQRYMPQELGATTSPSDSDVTNLLSRSSRGNDTFQSTSLVREQTQLKSESSSSSSSHFERKPRIVGLSAFQQKLSRSSDSMGQHSSSSNSLETSTDEPSPLYYEEKQRKTVEKARSFRNYQEERDVIIESASMHSNMPSLPDLSLSFRVPTSYYKQQQQLPQSPLTSPMSPNAKCVSLGFEINDNKLLQSRAESTGKLQQTKLSPQRNSTLLVTTPLGPANITQIEQNIDLIVKSPMVSLLRKSGTVEQQQPSLPQRPKVLELKQTTTIAIGSPGKDMASPLAKNAKLSSSPPPTTPSKNNQPEFMKIQLNRVDQARLHSKTNHLVLAKNVKSPTTPTERSQSSDDLSMRRLSKEVPATPAPQTMPIQSISQPTGGAGAGGGSLIKQQRAVSVNSLRSSYVSSSGSSSNGSSEVLVTTSPATPPKIRPMESIDLEKTNANRFSLEERKRLFLSEEKTQAERKLTERKKSNSEEGQKTPTTPSSPEGGNGNAVVLRKKSFGSSNGSTNSSTNGNPTGHEDPTPELMKVFARRSLKVKDDDVAAMAQIAVANHKKITNGSQSIDSDKENQSNSEEKLDKIPEPQPKIIQAHSQSAVANNNRSSVADFRNLNNNNVQQAAPQKLTNLPPIKVSNVRNNNNSNKNNNSNNSNNNSGVKHPNERYSLQLKSVTATTPTVATATIVAISTAVADAEVATPTKPIERSATVGEFKGIHQRRAEWEQRVKEALK